MKDGFTGKQVAGGRQIDPAPASRSPDLPQFRSRRSIASRVGLGRAWHALRRSRLVAPQLPPAPIRDRLALRRTHPIRVTENSFPPERTLARRFAVARSM